MYLYLSETNTPNLFYVRIPDGMDISGKIGLAELHFEFNRDVQFFDLCCDICEPSLVGSLVGSRELPVLRRIHALKRKEYVCFDPIYYIPVMKGDPCGIRIYLRSVQSSSSSVDLKSLNCTLHHIA